MVLLESLDQRETPDRLDLQDLEACLARPAERVHQGSRGVWDLKAHPAQKERPGPKEKQVWRASRALRGHKAPRALKETEGPPVSAEPPEVLGQQDLLESWVHQDLQVPKDPQD